MKHSLAPRTQRFRLRLEELEDRTVPSGLAPTAVEQLFLEQLNDVRANPAAYGQAIGLDLSGVAPSQPLAFDTRLIQSALGHSQDMSNANYFGHTGSDGTDPGQRMSNAGFAWTSYGESIAAGYADDASALQALIVDTGIPDLGHRRQLLAIDDFFKSEEQVGVGIVLGGSGQYTNYFTIDSAADSDTRPFITGVAFQDLNGNNKYDIGEGLANVTITVQGVGSVQTFDTGGYSIRVNPGTYNVTASGGSLKAPITQAVTVGSQNARLNFNPLALNPPTLQGPGGSITALRPSFQWNAVPLATSYEVWVNDLTTNQNKLLDVTGLTGTSWTPGSDLTLGHSYRWWVQAVNANAGRWSAAQDFTITPPPPTLQGPSGSINTLQPTFTWNSAAGADSYEVWINDLTTNQGKVLDTTGITSTSWTPTTALTLGHAYRWWVQAVHTGVGQWSASMDFTVALQGPTLLGPAGALGSMQPTFTWSAVPWATSYVVWANNLTTGQSQAIYQTGLSGTSFTPAMPCTPGNTYRWWVQAVGPNNAAVWSPSQDFNVVEPAPTLQGPGGGVNALLPTFRWNGVAWADNYEVWINDLTANQGKVLDTTGINGTSWTPSTPLTSGHSYRWWVQAVHAGVGEWSASLDFAVALQAPTLQGPAGALNALRPEFTWSAVPWANSYALWVNDLTTNQSQAIYQSGLTGTSWTPATALASGHNYRWWAQAVSPNNTALWSAAQDFNVSAQGPTLAGPSGPLDNLQPAFSWSAVPWANGYDVWVNDLTTGQSQALYQTNLNGTSWTPSTPLTPGHTYRWWAQADAIGGGLWSTSQDFTAVPPASNAPTALRTVSVSDAASLQQALNNATAGTWILLQPGTYQGGLYAGNLQGTAANPIVIAAADPNHRPLLQGGDSGLMLSQVAYVQVRNLDFTGANYNGINIDDGGNAATPSHDILLSGLNIHDLSTATTSYPNAIKLAGVNSFRVENSTIQNWGASGAGIDMVGCHAGEIQGCYFHFVDTLGPAGVQAKGGSANIIVRDSRFDSAGGVAIQAGGATGSQFFRPQPAPPFEAQNVLIEHNVISGSSAAISFANVDGSVARFNTIYEPKQWVIRIIQPNTDPSLVPSRNGVFTNNLVVFRSADVTWPINIGTGTAPQTFQFAGNWWYSVDNPAQSQPSLPSIEVGGTYGIDPQFVNAAGGDFHLQAGSPASGVGAYANG